MDEQVWFSRSHSINDYWKKIDGYELTPSLQKSLLLKEYNHIVKLILKFRLRRQIYRNETHNSNNIYSYSGVYYCCYSNKSDEEKP